MLGSSGRKSVGSGGGAGRESASRVGRAEFAAAESDAAAGGEQPAREFGVGTED